MFDRIRLRKAHGTRYIPDIGRAKASPGLKGLPRIDGLSCDGCASCVAVCPTGAIAREPMSIDIGRCVFCSDCVRACPRHSISFSDDFHMASLGRGTLVIGKNPDPRSSGTGNEAPGLRTPAEDLAETGKREFHRVFGRSIRFRQVSAGGCNGCEMELNACSNVNFDMQRFGIEFVASPRHADGIVVTGPVTREMAGPLEDAFENVPEPRIVVAIGACAISGGVFAGSDSIDRSFFDRHPVDLYVPGCPPHPLTFINGVIEMIGRK
jgi:Ni,Fe-hydrogenase III small subunit/formate hydrogenlyase subunit 6/NADH:ubiquinone oxidoreductase subunit I